MRFTSLRVQVHCAVCVYCKPTIITKLKIQCQQGGNWTYHIQLFLFSRYVFFIICTFKNIEYVYERMNCLLEYTT